MQSVEAGNSHSGSFEMLTPFAVIYDDADGSKHNQLFAFIYNRSKQLLWASQPEMWVRASVSTHAPCVCEAQGS